MRITLVTEFNQENYFQWREAWNIVMQFKLNTYVDTVVVNCNALKLHGKDNLYWNPLKSADVVFIYISRCSEPNIPYVYDGQKDVWNWWSLPKVVKKFMKPEAKMIVQTDDEWVWLQHPTWMWWGEKPVSDYGGPDNFFKSTNILEVADMWFTVLENPFWKKYTSKPVVYMPLPHLWRYDKEIRKAYSRYVTNGLNMHKNSLSLLRHSSSVADINSTIKYVAEPLSLPVTYFSVCWTQPHIPKFNVPVSTILYLDREPYMDILMNDCNVAIDDCTNYIGWSRFAMECAIAYVPCIGSNFAVKLFFPDLYTEHGDYSKQIELIKQLFNDKPFYKKVVEEGHYRMAVHLDPERLCKEMLLLTREELKPKETNADIERELLKNILRKSLPFSMIKQRPTESQSYFDDIHNRRCNQQQWDIWYSCFVKIINNEKLYREVVQEVLNESK
jgi:hypothetical protein